MHRNNIKIATITPTRGDRPTFFDRCKFYINRQTIKPDKIIIIDYPPKNNQFDLIERYRKGFEEAFRGGCDLVFPFEDDDWYHRNYIKTILNIWAINKPPMIGILNIIYYHLKYKKYKFIKRANRSAMSCSAFTKSILNIPWEGIGESYGNPNALDWFLWEKFKGMAINLLQPFVIGIKHNIGLCAGRYGHTSKEFYPNNDSEMVWLKNTIDNQSFNFYQKLIDGKRY